MKTSRWLFVIDSNVWHGMDDAVGNGTEHNYDRLIRIYVSYATKPLISRAMVVIIQL